MDAAFQDGHYRYDGMKLEVPKDQYADAVKLMEDKIRSEQVDGISDQAVAKDIVKQGGYLRAGERHSKGWHHRIAEIRCEDASHKLRLANPTFVGEIYERMMQKETNIEWRND